MCSERSSPTGDSQSIASGPSSEREQLTVILPVAAAKNLLSPAGPAHRPARRSLPVTLAYVRTPPRALKRKSDGFGGSGSPGAAES
jgi:hypothetical protein